MARRSKLLDGVSVYPRKGSPHFYVSYPDPKTYARKHAATDFRTDDPEGKKKAYEYALQLAKTARVHGDNSSERWEAWVEPSLKKRYAKPTQIRTLTRYLGAWKYWRLYFAEKNIYGPRAVTHQVVLDFLPWRMKQKKRSGKTVVYNTALTDVRALQVILADAVRREWIQVNPCRDLGISREPQKEKPEITDEEMDKIVKALDALVQEKPKKRWMRDAWEIARWQGCRVSETAIDLRRQLDLRDNTITFIGKGRNGRPTSHTAPLNPHLRPYLEAMIARGETVAVRFPPMSVNKSGRSGIEFREFFDSIGMPHIVFHCTRVTVITKLLRAEVPVATVMEIVGHASEEINRIYRRLKPRDVAPAWGKLSYKP